MMQHLVRLIHGDNNPEGPGFKSETIDGFGQTLKGRHQDTLSWFVYLHIKSDINVSVSDGFTIQAWIRATKPKQENYQGILAQNSDSSGFGLYVDPNGGIALRLVRDKKVTEVTTNHPIQEGQWYFVVCTYDTALGNAMVMQRQAGKWPNADADCEIFDQRCGRTALHRPVNAPITIAAGGFQASSGNSSRDIVLMERSRAQDYFPGHLSPEEIEHLSSDGVTRRNPRTHWGLGLFEELQQTALKITRYLRE